MKNKKAIIRFIIVFALSLLGFELVELIIEKAFGLNIHNLEVVWLGGVLVFLFKSHIICCIIPAIWSSYKCHHKEKKKCNHEHCS